MQRTIDFATSLPFDRIILNIAAPYPGTRMWGMIKAAEKAGGQIFVNRWQDFCNTSGKMLYTFPQTASPAEVEAMFKKAYWQFYFRPKYLFQKLPELFSFSQIPIMYRGLKRIFFSLHTS